MAVLLTVVTFFSTAAGGLFALRHQDRLHLILGFTAGVMLGVVAFDLLPEIAEQSSSVGGHARPGCDRAGYRSRLDAAFHPPRWHTPVLSRVLRRRAALPRDERHPARGARPASRQAHAGIDGRGGRGDVRRDKVGVVTR